MLPRSIIVYMNVDEEGLMLRSFLTESTLSDHVGLGAYIAPSLNSSLPHFHSDTPQRVEELLFIRRHHVTMGIGGVLLGTPHMLASLDLRPASIDPAERFPHWRPGFHHA